MKSIRYCLVILGAIGILLFAHSTTNVTYATATCPSTGIITGAPCVFLNAVDGVDAGSGSTNTGNLQLNSGGSVTVASQVIAVGKVTLNGGSLIINTGGSVKLGAPLYYNDADGDGYVANTTTMYTSTAGITPVRKYTNPTVDCNDGSATVKYTHAQCYADLDRDNVTSGPGAIATCLSASTCATSTGASASSTGAAVTAYTAGQLKDSVSGGGGDCNDGNAAVWLAHAQCYADLDNDTYTNGLQANTTCLNAPNCPSATAASASSYGAASTAYTLNDLKDAANGTDCGDTNVNAHSGQTTYYATTFTNTTTGLSYDWDCNGTEEKDPTQPAYSCSVTGCATHFFTIVDGWSAIPACGATGTWKVYSGRVAGTCATNIAGQGTTCPATTDTTPAERCN